MSERAEVKRKRRVAEGFAKFQAGFHQSGGKHPATVEIMRTSYYLGAQQLFRTIVEEATTRTVQEHFQMMDDLREEFKTFFENLAKETS